MGKLRPAKPSASMIVALIALFVAMGGTGYAAVTLGKNSVGSKQLKKNAVTTVKIKNGAVTNSKIKNGAVTSKKIKLSTLGTVPSAKLATNVADVQHWRTTITTPGASSTTPASTVLATAGPFTVLGECYTDGTHDYAYTAIESNTSGDWAQGYDVDYNGTLTPNTPQRVSDDAAENDAADDQFYGPDDGSWAAETGDGSLSLDGFGNQGVKLDGSSGPACFFSGFLVTQ